MTTPTLKLIGVATLTALTLTATGCSTLKNIGNKKEDVVVRAEKSDRDYYAEASDAIAKERYNQAITALNNIRTFYPTGRYAQQALLDLIYAHYNAGDYEATTAATAQFIQAYPTHPSVDYALYVQGVTHMEGSPKASRLIRLDQSQRDTAWLRAAFADFQSLVARYPNSLYAPDAAKRMTAIYNQFAEHELVAARWYIKRDAYVAAANRAKWAFQYYPQSAAVPEAIAILAYSNDKLGLTATANEYKTLLQINYPEYLTSTGQVILPSQAKTSWLKKGVSALSFGKIGKSSATPTSRTPYTGETYTQIIRASTLRLPEATNAPSAPASGATPQTPRIGFGLPRSDAEAGNTNSSHTTAVEAVVTPESIPVPPPTEQ